MLKLLYAIHPLFTGSGKVVEPIEGFQRLSRLLTPLRNIPDAWKTDRRVGKDGSETKPIVAHRAERPAPCGSPGFARPARPSPGPAPLPSTVAPIGFCIHPAPASLPSTVAPTGFCIHPDPESLPSTATPTSCCIHPAPVSLPSTATPTGCCTHGER